MQYKSDEFFEMGVILGFGFQAIKNVLNPPVIVSKHLLACGNADRSSHYWQTVKYP